MRYVSGVDWVWAPRLFYTYFLNHVHRLRLEKQLYLEPSRSSNGIFKPLLDPEEKRPLHGRFGSETDKHLTATYLTDIPQRTQVSVRV